MVEITSGVLGRPGVRLLLAGRRRGAVVTLVAALVAVRAWWGVEPGELVLSSERSS